MADLMLECCFCGALTPIRAAIAAAACSKCGKHIHGAAYMADDEGIVITVEPSKVEVIEPAGAAGVLTPAQVAEEPGRAAPPTSAPRLGLLFCAMLFCLSGCAATPPRKGNDILSSERSAAEREQLLTELYGKKMPPPRSVAERLP